MRRTGRAGCLRGTAEPSHEGAGLWDAARGLEVRLFRFAPMWGCGWSEDGLSLFGFALMWGCGESEEEVSLKNSMADSRDAFLSHGMPPVGLCNFYPTRRSPWAWKFCCLTFKTLHLEQLLPYRGWPNPDTHPGRWNY